MDSSAVDVDGTSEDITTAVSASDTDDATTNGSIFPPMFVLNLEKSTDRWEAAKHQMDDAGLKVERFNAIDGRTLSHEELRKVSTRLAMFLQPRGVLGCYLSHRAFWQMVVDRHMSSAIIFEDDVRLVPDFKPRLQGHLESLGNETFDVIMLGAIGRVHPEGKDHLGTRIFAGKV